MKSVDIKKINLSNVLFFIAYILFVVNSMIRWVENIDWFRQICVYAVLGILLVVIICKNSKVTYKSLFKILTISIVAILSYLYSGNNMILFLTLFIIASKDVEFNKIIKIDLIIKLTMLIVVFVLYSQGLTKQIILGNDIRGVRYAFGFGHPNTLAVYIMSICIDIIYLNYKKKNKILIYVLTSIVILLINIFCNSRGTMISIGVLITLSVLMPKIKNNKLFSKITMCLFPVFLVVSYVVAYIFNTYGYNEILAYCDKLFSYRISLMSAFLEGYDVNLFGNLFVDYSTINKISIYYVLDNGYIHLLLRYGLIATLLLTTGFMLKINDSFKKENYEIVICLIVYMVFGLMENGLFILFYNPFLLSLASLIYENKKKENVNNGTSINNYTSV